MPRGKPGLLQADIAATLKTRLQMMLEDAEEEGSQAPKGDDGGNGNSQGDPRISKPLVGWKLHPQSCFRAPAGVAASPIVTASGLGLFYLKHLPRRVAFPWSGSIMLSDYLFPGDTEDDAAAHAAQLLAFSPGSVKVVEWEAPPVREAASTEPAWHPLTGCAVAQPPDREAEGGGAAFGRCSMAVMICLAGAAGLATAYVAALMEG